MVQTVHWFLAKYARETPDSIALLGPGESGVPYATLLSAVRHIHSHLRRKGIHRDHRVGLVASSGPESVAWFLGVTSAASCIPLNPALSDEEMKSFLVSDRVQFLVVDEANRGAIQVAQALGIETWVITLHETFSPHEGRPQAIEVDWDDWPLTHELCNVFHTSGTTGKPKAVPYTHEVLVKSLLYVAEVAEQNANDRSYVVTPTFHSSGLYTALTPLLLGGSAICPRKFDVKEIFESLHDDGPTYIMCGPSVLQMMLSHGKSLTTPLRHRLRMMWIGTSAPGVLLLEESSQFFGIPVYQRYGSAEANLVAMMRPGYAPTKRASTGTPFHCEIRIVDPSHPVTPLEDGDLPALPAGEIGEILVRGELVMKGYLDDDEATQEVFVGDWYRTGDLGRLDEDGYLYFDGRLRDMINRAGLKVSPKSVEDVISQHPGVREVVAFPIPHPVLGQDLGVAILASDTELDELDIIRYAKARLAYFNVPSRVVFMDQLPRGSTGKVSRSRLAEQLGISWDDVTSPP